MELNEQEKDIFRERLAGTTYDVLSRRIQEGTAADFGKLERAIATAFEKGHIVDWMVLRLMRELREKK